MFLVVFLIASTLVPGY